MATKVPPLPKRGYNQTLSGIYGEFGSGAKTKIVFIQTAIRPADLGMTTLISDISGSETWPVRNLFQREVDIRRVTKNLLPYLQDQRRVKFFNPLTLTVLPFDLAKREVLASMPTITESQVEEDGQKWRVIEATGFYKYKHLVEMPAWGQLEWNDAAVKLVAIDGQHRLSALKRFQADPKADRQFQEWAIPVVIVGFRGAGDEKPHPTILEVVRSIFITINTEARTPTRTRQILLSDEDINAICTQELLQLSHSNDVLDEAKRSPTRVPLLFYDWRGEEDEGRPIPSPAAVKTIEEIADWFEFYVAGENFSPDQEVALGVQPVDAQLKRAFLEKRLDSEASQAVRERVSGALIPGVAHLLENFSPYKEYIVMLRQLEREYMAKSDVARHAFDELRFGSNRAGEALHEDVMAIFNQLVADIKAAQTKAIKPLLGLDIGMRGIVCAFGKLRELYSAATGKAAATWQEYAEWFTGRLNQVHADGWFDVTGRADVKALLRHVTEDHNGTVVNYRLDDAENALGAFVSLLVCAYSNRKGGILRKATELWDVKREELTDLLESCLMRGYRKEVRPDLREKYPKGGKELTEAVKKEATRRTDKHVKKLDAAIDAIVAKA